MKKIKTERQLENKQNWKGDKCEEDGETEEMWNEHDKEKRN